jgi:putative PIN family toxin of toxin-antitoxin system
MIRLAVIDTNVLVSALLSDKDGAATVQVVENVLIGRVTPVYSTDIIKEYREVLTRKKFACSIDLVEYLLAAIEKFGILISPASSGIVLPDMKDLPFYEVALEKSRADAFLVTGNIKHFPAVPFVVTPREFMDIIGND